MIYGCSGKLAPRIVGQALEKETHVVCMLEKFCNLLSHYQKAWNNTRNKDTGSRGKPGVNISSVLSN